MVDEWPDGSGFQSPELWQVTEELRRRFPAAGAVPPAEIEAHPWHGRSCPQCWEGVIQRHRAWLGKVRRQAEMTARQRRVASVPEDDGDAFWTEVSDDEYDDALAAYEAQRAEAHAEREREWRAAADLTEAERRLAESGRGLLAYLDGLAEPEPQEEEEEAVPEPLRGERRARLPIPKKVKKQVWSRDGGRCRNCGITDDDAMLRDGEHLHLDHIIPFSKNGADTVDNIQLLCGPCNREKAARES